MNEREFIELLNLYVDREINAEDALRLETEVAGNPRRREIYDQYCRIQKACSMLSEETLGSSPAHSGASVIAFPNQSPWRLGPAMAGLAAVAACAVAFVGLRTHGVPTSGDAGLAAVAPAHSRSANDLANARGDADTMKPVFLVHMPAEQAARASLLADEGSAAQATQLHWIGDIHMAPVLTPTNADFLLGPKAELKAAVLSDPQGRDALEPVEVAAFRFQR